MTWRRSTFAASGAEARPAHRRRQRQLRMASGLADLGDVGVGGHRPQRGRAPAALPGVAAPARPARVVYVDSGSTDGSVAHGPAAGARRSWSSTCTGRFTAARARNAGFARLLRAVAPALEFVQFVDGDCEVVDGWLARAERPAARRARAGGGVRAAPRAASRSARSTTACATSSGTRRSGRRDACGGDAMMRVVGVRGGRRLRPRPDRRRGARAVPAPAPAGWRILRVDAEMTLHDAAMTRFGQWWRRMSAPATPSPRARTCTATRPSATGCAKSGASGCGARPFRRWRWARRFPPWGRAPCCCGATRVGGARLRGHPAARPGARRGGAGRRVHDAGQAAGTAGRAEVPPGPAGGQALGADRIQGRGRG